MCKTLGFHSQGGEGQALTKTLTGRTAQEKLVHVSELGFLNDTI